MKKAVGLMMLVACDGGGEVAVDGAMTDAAIDTIAIDAPMIDAAPTESCTASGWCSVPDAPSYAWALSVTPNGQAWTAAYGAYRKKATAGWDRFEPTWDDLVDPFRFHTELYSVFALSPTDVWAGGRQGYVGHFDGVSFQERRPAAPWALGIWGASTDDVWFLYDSGLRYRWNGSQLVSNPTSDVEYSGAWGRAANEVYGFGETEVSNNSYRPAIDHFDGTQWTMTIVPGFGVVQSLWAASPTDIWAVVRLNGTTRVIRGSGATWTTISDPAVAQITAVWGRSANEVWAVGTGGRIVRWNGTSWSTSSSGTTKTLTDISGTASTIWATGDGVALHRDQ
jgi:hypothetical protein